MMKIAESLLPVSLICEYPKQTGFRESLPDATRDFTVPERSEACAECTGLQSSRHLFLVIGFGIALRFIFSCGYRLGFC